MYFFFFQAEDGIRDYKVTGVQTCALPIYRGVQLAIALVQYDMGDYAAAQPVLNEMLRDKLLGRPLREEKTADGFRMVPNDAYWDALLKLCWSNVKVARAGGERSSKILEDTQQYLKQ